MWQRAPVLALCSPFDTLVGLLPTVLSVGLVRGDDSLDGYSFEIELLFVCDCSCIELSRLVKAPSSAGSVIMVC